MCNRSRVVLTGFGPFGGTSVNSSTTAVLNLQSKWEAIRPHAEFSPELVVLPNVEVSYQAADKVVSYIWDDLKPVRLFTFEFSCSNEWDMINKSTSALMLLNAAFASIYAGVI